MHGQWSKLNRVEQAFEVLTAAYVFYEGQKVHISLVKRRDKERLSTDSGLI
jgi:hypothetical protein